MSELFRRLPSVHQLAEQVARQLNGELLPHTLVVEAARAALEDARARLASGDATAVEELEQVVHDRLRRITQPSLRSVINASGVIIQTNLGRAPLSEAALAAMHRVGSGYSNLEYDLNEGVRGSRHVHLKRMLCQLSGAEDALAVNNAAAALYLALISLAYSREVLISRGQSVEIGGGFRIPDVLRQSGALLVEVGTTNRTYARDYLAAISERTALIMRVHTSNFRLVGFVHETSLAELSAIGREHELIVLDDLGSGSLLDTQSFGLAPEPTVQESIRTGADLVVFSGDKLLGGPQAGLIVGRAKLIEQLRRHPLARALRVDKTTIAALEATLLSYMRGAALSEVPVWRMIAASVEGLRIRSDLLAAHLVSAGWNAASVACQSTVGGGSLPGETLPSFGVALQQPALNQLAARLRAATPAVVGRIGADRLLLDLRTVLPEQDELLAQTVAALV